MTATLEHLAGGIGIVRENTAVYFVPYSGSAYSITEEQTARFKTIGTDRIYTAFTNFVQREFQDSEHAIHYTRACLAFQHLALFLIEEQRKPSLQGEIYFDTVKKRMSVLGYDTLLLSLPGFKEQGFAQLLETDFKNALDMVQNTATASAPRPDTPLQAEAR